MDAGIADAINRRDVTIICARLDALDLPKYNDSLNSCPCVHCAPFLDAKHGNGCSGYHCHGTCVMKRPPWHFTAMADTLMSEQDSTRSQRAWIVGQIAINARGIAFDGCPADCDWDNLFQHFRNAIRARRDPKTPHGPRGCEPRAVVV